MHKIPRIGLEGREPGRSPQQFIGNLFYDIDVMTICAVVSVDYGFDKISLLLPLSYTVIELCQYSASKRRKLALGKLKVGRVQRQGKSAGRREHFLTSQFSRGNKHRLGKMLEGLFAIVPR
jgi:hypothetical protein